MHVWGMFRAIECGDSSVANPALQQLQDPGQMIIKTIPPLAKTGRAPGWMDLVTRTTPGMRDMGMVRVQVSSSLPGADGDEVTRLIVQVYDRTSFSAIMPAWDGGRS